MADKSPTPPSYTATVTPPPYGNRCGGGGGDDDAELAAMMGEYATLVSKVKARTSTKAEIARAKELKAVIKSVDSTISKEPPDWSTLPVKSARVWIPDLPTSKQHLRTERQPVHASGTHKVQIARFPFARGSVRVAYHARVQEKDGQWKPYIVKEFLEPKNRLREEYLCQLETNAVAMFLAKEWMKTPTGRQGKKISFIKSRALEVHHGGATEAAAGTSTWYHLEGVVPGRWDKWTNNGGYCDASPQCRTLLEFAQWTHSWTGGFMMATDLQGGDTGSKASGWVLTDPAILCTDESRFGQTNFDPEAQMSVCCSGLQHAMKRGKSMVDKSEMGSSYRSGFAKRDDGSRFRRARKLAAVVEEEAAAEAEAKARREREQKREAKRQREAEQRRKEKTRREREQRREAEHRRERRCEQRREAEQRPGDDETDGTAAVLIGGAVVLAASGCVIC